MKIASALAAVLLLTACGDTDDLGPGTEPDPAEQEDQEPEDTEEAEEPVEDLEPDEDEQAEGILRQELDDPVVYEDSGVRLSITGVGLSSMDSPEVDESLGDFVEDDTQTVLALEMTASNDSGAMVDFYPDQGTVHVGREQVEADLFLSESVGGADMRDGVDNNGLVVWQLTAPYDEVVAEGQLTFAASAPVDSESFDQVGGEVELTVEWDAP